MPRASFRFVLIASISFAGIVPLFSGDATTEVQQKLLQDIKYLSSDELEGRGVGTKGLDLAADYIRDQFIKAGLDVKSAKGTAYQTFSMTTGAKLSSPNKLELAGPDGKKIELKFNTDFVTASFGGAGTVTGDLVFCGYGIESKEKKYDDFADIDLKGKIAVILRRNPQQNNPHGPFGAPNGGVSREASLDAKVSAAFGKGAAAILFVNDPYTSRDDLAKAKTRVTKLTESVASAAEEFDALDTKDSEKQKAARDKLGAEIKRLKAEKETVAKGEQDQLMNFGHGGRKATRSIPIWQITQAACDQILKAALNTTLAELEATIDKDFTPRSAIITGWKATGTASIERIQTEVKNVVGVLEGTGPLAQETVVVGAHYDHVGRGGDFSLARGSNEIHNGADDNASGTVCLIEVARRLAARKEKLPRRVVFIAFTGEESGLIGSDHYVKEPLFPLEKTIAMINMDMVGRLKEDNKLTIYGTGTSPVWNDLVLNYGKEFGFEVAQKPQGFGPSDHSSFYGKQIPVLHFFTGTHPDYHRPSDDWEKINIPGLARVTDMIEKTVIQTVTATERPPYVFVPGSANIDRGPARNTARPYFGSIPDFGSETPGYSLSGVAPDSPAEKAGLKAGDRIVQIGTDKIDNLEDFDQVLRKFKGGDTVDVMIARDNDKVTVKVTLDQPR